MFKKKKTYVILGIIILTLVGIYFVKKDKNIATYTTSKVERGTLKRTVSVTGEIIAPLKVNVSSKLGGQMEAIWVDVGDQVKKGQKIAKINEGSLNDQLAQASYELEAQKRLLSNMKRRDETYNYFQKQAQREVVKKNKSVVAEILKKIDDATLYSSLDGVVIKKNIESGESVIANEVIATIAGAGELQIQVEVPESDIVDVALGQKARVSLDAFSDDEGLIAQVFEIEPASTVIQDVVYYKVKLKFDSPDERLKVGMSTDVDINIEEKKDILRVPLRAVKTEGDKNYVEVLKEKNTVERVFVETGLSGDEGMIEIFAGLSGEENVIILTAKE